MRTNRVVDCVGGKGFDTSVVLRAFEVDTVGLGIMAGETGKLLEKLLLRYGIRPDLIWVKGETRLAHVLSETELHRHSHVMVGGYTVSPKACQDFLARFRSNLDAAQYVVLGGSIPDGLGGDFYQILIEEARLKGVSVLVDCPGEPVRAAIAAHPAIIKMNNDEFAQTFGCETGSFDRLLAQAREVKSQRGIANLVLTLGKKGILALADQGDYLASAPEQHAVNAAGAGDAVSAILAWRLAEGDPWEDALRLAAAVSAAVVLTEGTADCNRADAERILPQVEVKTL